MVLILSILGVVTAALAVCVIASAARSLRSTTLWTAWAWALAFSVLGLGLVTIDSMFALLSSEWSEILWYLTAITGLCPAVAVLGARRPVDRVWNLFVILPLLAVLGWPVMTVLMHGLSPRLLQLDAPPLLAYGLVLVMSYGNYVGTRFGVGVILAAAGQSLLVAPLAGEAIANMTVTDSLRPLGLICISAGVVLARLLAKSRERPDVGLDRLWRDFRNSFGVVWSRRIMDRFQQQAQQQQLGVRLAPGGFAWKGGQADQAEQREAERIMRWLLRRFVDEEWIDRRINP